jgi:hypothetical protein
MAPPSVLVDRAGVAAEGITYKTEKATHAITSGVRSCEFLGESAWQRVRLGFESAGLRLEERVIGPASD